MEALAPNTEYKIDDAICEEKNYVHLEYEEDFQ